LSGPFQFAQAEDWKEARLRQKGGGGGPRSFAAPFAPGAG